MSQKSSEQLPLVSQLPRRRVPDLRSLTLPLFIVVVAGVINAIEPRFSSGANMSNLLRQIAPLLVLAVGQTFVIIGGGLDLSNAATLAAAGVIGVMVMGKVGIAAGVGAMAGAGILIGTINGLLITRFKVSPFITTLGTMSVIKGLTLVLSGGLPLYGVPDRFLDIFGDGRLLGLPVGSIMSIACVLFAGLVLRKTVLGRYVYALGASASASYNAGVPISLVTVVIYGLSGLMSGIAAIVMTGWVSAAQPLAGAGLDLQSIAAAVIGGVALTGGIGRISGVVFGVVILGMLSNGLNMVGVSSFYQTVSVGVIILIAVILDKIRMPS
jgi:ribose/xylose/arabinose/galactoside ABC-type transport system permease subunit